MESDAYIHVLSSSCRKNCNTFLHLTRHKKSDPVFWRGALSSTEIDWVRRSLYSDSKIKNTQTTWPIQTDAKGRWRRRCEGWWLSHSMFHLINMRHWWLVKKYWRQCKSLERPFQMSTPSCLTALHKPLSLVHIARALKTFTLYTACICFCMQNVYIMHMLRFRKEDLRPISYMGPSFVKSYQAIRYHVL